MLDYREAKNISPLSFPYALGPISVMNIHGTDSIFAAYQIGLICLYKIMSLFLLWPYSRV